MDDQDQPAAVRRPISVMLVDDDLIVRARITELLAVHRDLHVLGAFPGGREALAAAERTPPDVMVVDISMPGMNGEELTRAARSRHPGTRFLAFTSLADQPSIAGMMGAGAAGVVYKDASVDALADAIRATHSGLSVLSPRFNRAMNRPRPDRPLTRAEGEILRLVSRGLTNEQIAPLVGLSASTVKYHLSKLADRLGAHNRVGLAVRAVQLGLADDDIEA